jgi:hypothetical protein
MYYASDFHDSIEDIFQSCLLSINTFSMTADWRLDAKRLLTSAAYAALDGRSYRTSETQSYPLHKRCGCM